MFNLATGGSSSSSKKKAAGGDETEADAPEENAEDNLPLFYRYHNKGSCAYHSCWFIQFYSLIVIHTLQYEKSVPSLEVTISRALQSYNWDKFLYSM